MEGVIYRKLSRISFIFLLSLLVATTAPTLSRAQDITTGLVGHWKLDETSGTSVIDYASTNNGTLAGSLDPGADSVPGKLGTALAFDDATNDGVDIGDVELSSTSITLSAWVKPSAPAMGSDREIFSKFNGFNGQRIYTLRLNASNQFHRHFSVDGSASGGNTISSPGSVAVIAGHWYHVVATLDHTTGHSQLFVNGVLDHEETKAAVTGIFDNTTPVRIGTRNPSYDTGATIDDVRVYNRALTAEDVAELHARWDGHTRYNTAFRVAEYFDGEEWVAMSPKKQYVPNAVNFDGSVTYLEASLASGTDTKKVTGSVWVRRAVNDANQVIVRSGSQRFNVQFRPSGQGNDIYISAISTGRRNTLLLLVKSRSVANETKTSDCLYR